MPSDPTPPDPATIVLTFLESVATRSESEFYVRLFRQLPKESFAVLAAESAVLRYALSSLVDQLRFLRDLGLFAPVVVGLFEPRSAERAALRLTERCEGMNPRIHDARQSDLVAEVAAELTTEQLPIISLAKFGPKDADERFRVIGDLVSGLRSRKLVVLRRRGGIGPHGSGSIELGPGHFLMMRGSGISIVNVTTDYESLKSSGLVAEDGELLEQLRTLLLRQDCRSTIAAVTSPLNLLTELFTAKGAGTLIKRGCTIERFERYEQVDLVKLRALLESSFERKLAPKFVARRPSSIYVEEHYLAAAIVEPGPCAPWLTKFAVERAAQGEGMGRDLWQAVVRDYPALCWRARATNPIAGWYATLCDGMMRTEKWIVYFRGISADQVPAVVQDALSRTEDFL